MAGPAITSVLSGEYNPGGKLPYTLYPMSIMDRPFTAMNLQTDGGITHQWYKGTPDYAFGAGGSYTTFSYRWPSASDGGCGAGPGKLGIAQVAKAPPRFCVAVTNTGDREGSAVVLAFITSAHPDWPSKRLFGFARHSIKRGASVTVSIQAAAEFASTVSEDGVRKLLPGSFEVSLGDIDAPARHRFELTGPALTLEAYPS